MADSLAFSFFFQGFSFSGERKKKPLPTSHNPVSPFSFPERKSASAEKERDLTASRHIILLILPTSHNPVVRWSRMKPFSFQKEKRFGGKENA
jgi:hypothetical protein